MEEDKNSESLPQNQTPAPSTGISFSARRLDSGAKLGTRNDKQVTLGGVKKPRFKPKSKASVPPTDASAAMNSLLPPSFSSKPEPKSETGERPVKQERQDRGREKRETHRKPTPKSEDPRARHNLVSSGVSFFATGSFHRERNRLNDADGARRAILLEQGITEFPKQEVREDVKSMELDPDEDRELPEEDNGPMRVPYTYSDISWKETDEFSPPPTAELLEEVVDDELMLFSFPSFMPIYKNYPEYPQGFPNEPKGAHKAEPFDFVHNNLKGLEEGWIGKMRIHQSGRVTISVNDVVYELGVGIPMKYVEDAVYINEETKTVDMLGHLTQRIQVSPNLHVYDS